MSGERKGRRDQMDKFVQKMTRQGFDRNYIKRKAVQCAIRADRKDDQKQGEK